MDCQDLIERLTERALASGYTEVESISPAAARELKLLDFVSFARRDRNCFHVFGVRPGDGMQLEQLRSLSDQFHNAGALALKEGIGIESVQTSAILAYAKSPRRQDVDYYLGRAHPRWPLASTRSTPLAIDLERRRVLKPLFASRAVSVALLEECLVG